MSENKPTTKKPTVKKAVVQKDELFQKVSDDVSAFSTRAGVVVKSEGQMVFIPKANLVTRTNGKTVLI